MVFAHFGTNFNALHLHLFQIFFLGPSVFYAVSKHNNVQSIVVSIAFRFLEDTRRSHCNGSSIARLPGCPATRAPTVPTAGLPSSLSISIRLHNAPCQIQRALSLPLIEPTSSPNSRRSYLTGRQSIGCCVLRRRGLADRSGPVWCVGVCVYAGTVETWS